MSESKMRFRIGLFVLATLVLLAGLIYMFGNFPQMFRSREGQLYTVQFTDAPGVAPGTPVRRSGVRIGEVENVSLSDETGEVTVVVRIQPGYTIRHADQPTLIAGLLTGDTTIDLLRKELKDGEKPDLRPVDPQSPLRGLPPANVNNLLRSATAVVSPAQKALEEIQKSLKEVEKIAPELKATLKEYRSLATDVRRVIPDFNDTNKEIRGLARDVRATIPEIKATNKEIQGVASQIRTAIPDFQMAAKEFANLARDVRGTLPEINETTKEARKLLKGANETLPIFKELLQEAQITARNWGSVGERVNVLLTTNQDKINSIIENTDKTTKGMSNVFGEENQQRISTILGNVTPASKQFPEISRNANNMLLEGRGLIRRFETTLDGIDGAVDNLRDFTNPDSETSKGFLKNLSQASLKLNTILGDVQVLVKTAARSDGTVRRFLADPAIYNHLDDVVVMVAKVIPRMDRILKDFEVFADKLARHPESIGLGGLVRPSSGVKDAPGRGTWRPNR